MSTPCLVYGYRYFEDQWNEGPKTSSYYVEYYFDHHGVIDQETIETILEDQKQKIFFLNTHKIGPFIEMSDLERFALRLADELRSQKIVILSVQEFNAIVLEQNRIDGLYEHFLNGGRTIYNEESNKSGGLLNKFFN